MPSGVSIVRKDKRGQSVRWTFAIALLVASTTRATSSLDRFIAVLSKGSLRRAQRQSERNPTDVSTNAPDPNHLEISWTSARRSPGAAQ